MNKKTIKLSLSSLSLAILSVAAHAQSTQPTGLAAAVQQAINGRVGAAASNAWTAAWVNFKVFGGMGLMLGLKCKAPNLDVVKAGYDQHLLTVGASDNVIRILPPLNIPDEDIAEALRRLDAAATALEAA